MVDPNERIRRGSHRGRPELARGASVSALAVGAVAVLVIALLAWQGHRVLGRSDGGQTAIAASASAKARLPSVTATAGAAIRPRTSSVVPSAGGSSSATASVAATGPKLPVGVLNQSGRTGLAARTAALVRRAGWRVVAVGNSHGGVPATTVYYPTGAKDQASALAAALPGADRVRPSTPTMSSSRLTLVLTSTYPG